MWACKAILSSTHNILIEMSSSKIMKNGCNERAGKTWISSPALEQNYPESNNIHRDNHTGINLTVTHTSQCARSFITSFWFHAWFFTLVLFVSYISSAENQKGAIAVQNMWPYSALLVLNGTSLNSDTVLLVLRQWFPNHGLFNTWTC